MLLPFSCVVERIDSGLVGVEVIGCFGGVVLEGEGGGCEEEEADEEIGSYAGHGAIVDC